MKRLEMGEVILEALFFARGTLLERGITVKTDLAADAPMAIGDRIQLQQLVLNLIMNAVDAMSGVTDRPRELIIRLSSTPHDVLIQVQDSGRGLDPEHAPHIFDPFYSTKPHGIGMGLSLCRSIVQAHGGRLWFIPGSPHGTIFQFTLRKAENHND
jgi:signal transduction histidine kinase